MSPFINISWLLVLLVNIFANGNEYVALNISNLSVQHTTWKAQDNSSKKVFLDVDNRWEEETEGESEEEAFMPQPNTVSFITPAFYQFLPFINTETSHINVCRYQAFVGQCSQGLYLLYQNFRI